MQPDLQHYINGDRGPRVPEAKGASDHISAGKNFIRKYDPVRMYHKILHSIRRRLLVK